MFVAYEKRQCVVCNTPFIPKAPNQKFCSQKCSRRDRSRRHYQRNKEKVIKENKKYYQKNKRKEYRRIAYRLKKINETCAMKHNNCFSCPYEDCIQE